MMEELAPAKINLALDVLGLRYDYYHDVETVLHSVNLSDSIYIEEAPETVFSCNDVDLPCGPGNLAYDALMLIKKYTGIRSGVRLHLLKRVPSGAGLGGGSADAAAVLRGLNRFWNLRLQRSELYWLAKQLGADVPFCLYGGAAFATGRGDVLEELPTLPESWIVIVKPVLSISTAKAYELVDERKHHRPVDVIGVRNAVSAGNADMVWRRMGNVFEEPLFTVYPELRRIKETFERMRCPVLMSGSGSAFFVIVPKARDGGYIVDKMKEQEPGWKVLITKTRGKINER